MHTVDIDEQDTSAREDILGIALSPPDRDDNHNISFARRSYDTTVPKTLDEVAAILKDFKKSPGATLDYDFLINSADMFYTSRQEGKPDVIRTVDIPAFAVNNNARVYRRPLKEFVELIRKFCGYKFSFLRSENTKNCRAVEYLCQNNTKLVKAGKLKASNCVGQHCTYMRVNCNGKLIVKIYANHVRVDIRHGAHHNVKVSPECSEIMEEMIEKYKDTSTPSKVFGIVKRKLEELGDDSQPTERMMRRRWNIRTKTQ